MEKRKIVTIGKGKVMSLGGKELIWSVVVGEEVKLNRGDRIDIYRNSVGHLSLTLIIDQ